MLSGKTYFLLYFLFAGVLAALPAAAQQEVDVDALKKAAARVFIDCSSCDLDYIRTEIAFVNYVRERKEAQVHILVTTMRTGSGGREYTISFIGQREFQGVNDTQKYFSNQTDTEDEIRRGLVEALKIGLMSYVARTPIGLRMAISYAGEEKPEAADKWNYWVFSLSTGGFFRGEESYESRSLRASFSANRVTPDLKIRMSVAARHSSSTYEYDSQTITSTTEGYEVNGLFVKSLNDHWSIGACLRAASSTYENILFSFSPSPAVEVNFFPYAQSTRRQLRCLYSLKFASLKYREETIYDKKSENVWGQSLSVTLDLKEKWGTISTTLAASHYFHDFSKNQQTLFTVFNLHLIKGLSVFVLAGGARIHDQLYLAKGEASLEEVLLRRKQLATSYNYYLSMGLSYTFGSVFTNVVNPRFGDSGMGGVSINID
ncbi:MAG: hypothetical protein QHH14_07155 [Clostridiales bacterium]|nr:hypothetical protein [Clostridiales bacterium]